MLKEVCVESFTEAQRAVAAGANRIELCENLYVGGTTPSFGTIKKCLESLPVPVLVMIRPRGGDFCYSESEIEIMKEDIAICKKIGVRGVVFGVLTPSKRLDMALLQQLVQLARPMEITFHKAIDEVDDLVAAAKEISLLGIERILSSGGKPTATEGAETLCKMVAEVSEKTAIVVAGKVTFGNIAQISSLIPAKEFHGRRLVDF